ncbi:MAG: helix-turn-helix transcriptional regulator [Azospirillaceae bacterium]
MELSLGLCSEDAVFIDRVRMIAAVEGWEVEYCTDRHTDARFPASTNLLLTNQPTTFAPLSQRFRLHRRGGSIAAVESPQFSRTLPMEQAFFDRVVIVSDDLERFAGEIELSAHTIAHHVQRGRVANENARNAGTAPGLNPRIAALLRNARRGLGLTQKDLAGRLGISHNRYRRREIDGGKIEIDFLLRFANEVGLTPDALIQELDAVAAGWRQSPSHAPGTPLADGPVLREIAGLVDTLLDTAPGAGGPPGSAR